MGNILLFLTAFIWGTAFVSQRSGMDYIGPFTFNGLRWAIAALAVGLVDLVLYLRRKKTEGQGRNRYDYRKTLIGGLSCGALLMLASTFQQIGLVTTSAGKAGFITALYILLVPFLNLFILKKHSPMRIWAAVALGLFGMYLLCISGDFSLGSADAMLILSAITYSFHILAIDHFGQEGDPIAMSALQFGITALVSLIIAFGTESPAIGAVLSAIVPLLYCGLMSGGVAYTLQMVAQPMTDPTVASLIMSLESVFAALAGAVLLHERMAMRELMGCIIMFAAIILVQLPVRRSAHA
ncbi:MAG: DMT family transporter [Lachnospiraceae bacterium]|nr:DMT family transporter [Lachnospiraceae bacterium]